MCIHYHVCVSPIRKSRHPLSPVSPTTMRCYRGSLAAKTRSHCVSHTKNVTSPGISVSLPRRDMPRISVSRRSPQTKARKTFCAPEAPRTLYLLLLSLGSPDTPSSRKTPTKIVVLVKTSVTPGVERQSKGQLVRPRLSMAAALKEKNVC